MANGKICIWCSGTTVTSGWGHTPRSTTCFRNPCCPNGNATQVVLPRSRGIMPALISRRSLLVGAIPSKNLSVTHSLACTSLGRFKIPVLVCVDYSQVHSMHKQSSLIEYDASVLAAEQSRNGHLHVSRSWVDEVPFGQVKLINIRRSR